MAVLRAPGGAVVALEPDAPNRDSGLDIVWQVLHTADVARAMADHAALFGWSFAAPSDGGPMGIYHPFAWAPGGPTVGVLGDTAGRPGVHPHWLFHFRVEALDHALATVRARGGVVLGPWTTPGGYRVAACDDPQGAAFGLAERPPHAGGAPASR